MGPEWFLEAVLVCAGLLAVGAAVSLLASRQRMQAARLGAAGVALLLVAFALGRSERLHNSWRGGQEAIRSPLKPAHLPPAPAPGPESDSVTLFRLGDATLRVRTSTRYVFSVDGKTFLTLRMDSSGMFVDGDVASEYGHRAVRFTGNSFGAPLPGIRATRPDSSTLRVEERDQVIFAIRFAEPRKIEMLGQLLVEEGGNTFRVTPSNGVHWKGGSLPGGSSIDLSQQGTGAVNFEPSGLVQIVDKPARAGRKPE